MNPPSIPWYDRLARFISQRIGIDFRPFVRSGFWVLAAQAISLVFGLLLVMTFARLVPKEVFGYYQFVVALLGVTAFVSIPEMNASILQSVANHKDGTYRRALSVRFKWGLLGIPLFFLIAAFYFYFREETTLSILIVMAGLFYPFYQCTNSWEVFYQAKERFDQTFIYRSIQSALMLVSIVGVALLTDGDPFYIILTYLVVFSGINLWALWKSFRLVQNEKVEKGWKSYGQTFNKINILAILTGRLDMLLVGTFLGPAALAVYGIGTQFATLFENSIRSLLMTVTPTISRVNTLNGRMYLKIFLICAVLTIPLIFASPFLITLLFTDSYQESIFLSQIIFAFFPFFVLNNLYEKHIKYYLKSSKLVFLATFFTPIIRLSLMFILLYYWEMAGLALAQGLKPFLSIMMYFLLTQLFPKELKKRQ